MVTLESQYQVAREIEREYQNYKKDGADRKNNVEYFKRRWSRMEEWWNEFQFNHDQLLESISRSDPYFTSQQYEKTKEIYTIYKNNINSDYQKLFPSTSVGEEKQSNIETEQKDKEEEKDERKEQQIKNQRGSGERGSLSKLDETLRRQWANFKAFARTVSNINIEIITDKWEFEDALKSIEARWSAIDMLHWQIDSELDGKDLDYEAKFTKYETQYNTLKKQLNKKMWAVSHREKSTPKLDIPIFTGNYTQWTSFKDLFNEAIHENSTLSPAQKMQFLKSNVKGEAERLIQHLAISSDNYQTCWEILNHRYNNERLIFTSLLNNLFGLPTMQQSSLSQIKKMHDITIETLNALKNLGVDVTTWDPIIVHILCQKLDAETYGSYVESVKNPRALPILQELLDYLESKFTILETSYRRKQEMPHQKPNFSQIKSIIPKKQYFNTYRANNGNEQVTKSYHVASFKCPLCQNEHGIYSCRQFLQMSHEKRLLTVNRLGICVNCLFSHNGNKCTSNKVCRKCSGQHNTLMHYALIETKPTSNDRMNSTSHASQDDFSEVLLATALLKVQKKDGTYQNMRALVDQGSQISIITENAAQALGLKRKQCKGVIFGVGQRENNCKGKIYINCKSIHNDYTFQTEVIIMGDLIKNLPNKSFTCPSWEHIRNINLADPEFYKSRPVDLLLGADIYTDIALGGLIKGNDSTMPMAQQTQLGWLLCGSARTFQCNMVINNVEDIQQFWEMEEITEEGEENMSSEDIYCMDFFQKTTTRNEQGRYEVRLPMKPNFEEQLGTSKPKALAQFRNLEQKFKKQEKLAAAYKTFMNEYAELNHMKLDNNETSIECVLPHHGVERAESSTTKYRVVFNASSKTGSGYSLNDLMFKGPNLQQDLQSLLIKFRQFKFAFIADIEKMYRQILMNKEDQPLQKIVWRDSPNQTIQTYLLQTLTYGTKAASFIAMMTLKRLASDERENFPEAAGVLEDSFYMDDLLYGSHTINQGQQLVKDLQNLLQRGGFNLRKWSSNKPEILSKLDNQQSNPSNTEKITFEFKTENTSKTLGLCWNPDDDEFTFRCELNPQTSKLTKRILLSEISRIFDPLGWLAPVIIKMKLLFQKVWKTNITWDTEVTDEIKKEWLKISEDINKTIKEIKIQRWILSTENDVIELHGFCDASLQAFGCVIYARIKKQNRVVMVAAKTKLVPLKKILSLPKLELSGAFLLTKLMHKVKNALNQLNIETHGWTDSQVVLGWLRGEPNRWKPFVANRVRKITEEMPEQQWNYVKTDDNPADAASRGLMPHQLKKHSLWWSGPTWLQSFEPELVLKQTFETNQEKKTHQSNITQQIENDNIINNLITKYSSFHKITRIVAWIQRAFTPKRKQRPSQLTLQEIENAKLTIIKNEQNCEFRTEIEELRKHGNVGSKSKLLNLNPFIDDKNILRVGGRLSNSSISYEMKHPKIIASGSRLADLLIDQAHKQTLHGGPRLTLAKLRQEYWITGGNNIVKKQLRKCVTCRKQDGKTQEQLMGDLPSARCNIANPFYHTGVDYTGFVNVKLNKGRGARTTKGYVAIFICMITKAVHLELVSDLSSSAFLAALRRMVARRGTPGHLYSDNGTNFVGANRALQEQWPQLEQFLNENFLAELTEMKIEWHFNAPAWPSAGGLWERAVRSLKYHLRRVVGQQKLTFEEYSTILTQIEACLNSRPLCALTENIEDLDFLSPAKFLIGRSEVTVINTEEDARTRWHLTQKLFQDIWKRWKTEYLSQITTRGKWRKPQPNIEIGDMVLIHEDNLPPGKWAMGRVIEVHPGTDGYVRVVTVKTKNGLLKRPIVKLSLLPLKTETVNNATGKDERLEQVEQETSLKNRRKQGNNNGKKSTFMTVTLACMAIMNIFVPGTCFQVTPLNEKQGLYFDRMANMLLIRDEWKIVAYYNMDPFWEGTSAYEKYYKHLDSICHIISHLTHCEILMLQLRHEYNELEHNNRVLLNQQMSARARKRRHVSGGLINGIGYIAGDLFGVLDNRFAEQYERDISLVRDNQKHLVQLYKNQTSIVEAEYNLLKRTEDMIQKQHKLINQHLLNLDRKVGEIQKVVSDIEYMTEFTLSAMTATNLLTHLKNIQESLLDTITNVYNGRINIHLIDPEQLQTQLNIISGQLAKELSLPIDNLQINMHNIYKLLGVKAKVTSKYLIMEIKVPLLSRDNFDLYSIQSVPYQVGKSMVTLTPIESYIAMNLQKDSYLPIAQPELEHCIPRDASTYLCHLKTPMYKMKTDNDLCIKDAINLEQCKTRIMACQNKWISLTQINQYLYFCCDRCQLRTICNDQVTAHQLTGANIITMKNSCLVKTENFTIYTHKQQENRIDLLDTIIIPEIAPINNVINVTIGNVSEERLTEPTIKDEQHTELEQKIKAIKESEGLIENNISVHDIHHYFAIWVLWAIIAIIAIVLISRRYGYCRQHQQSAAEVLQTAAYAAAAMVDMAGPSLSPQQVPRSSTSDKCSESDKVNVCGQKDKGTSPVLRKIAFSDNL